MEQGHKKKTAVIVVASTEVVSGMLIVGITIAEAGNPYKVRLLTLDTYAKRMSLFSFGTS